MTALEQALRSWDSALAQSQAALAGQLPQSRANSAVQMHLTMALAWAQRGSAADALRELNAAIALSPRDVDAHTVLGLVHGQLTANAVAAGSAFRVAVGAAEAAPLQRYLLAKHLADQGALEEAAAVSLQLRIDSRSADGPDRAPFIRLHLIPEVPGIEAYFPSGRYVAAVTALGQANYADAVARLKAAIATDPMAAPPVGAARALTEAGTAFRDGDVAAALSALDRAEQAAPQWSDTHRLRGIVLAAADRLDDAVRSFTQALTLAPANERAHLALADALAGVERYEDAAAALRLAIGAVPDSPRLQHALGRVLQRLGQYPEALEAFDRSLAMAPPLPLLGKNSVFETVGTLRRARQEFQEATAAFSARVNLVPNDVAAHRDLGDLYFRQGLDDLAWTELAIAEALSPRDVGTQALLAQLHLRNERFAEAVAAAKRTIALDAAHAQGHYVLGTALLRMDQAADGGRALDTFKQLQTAEAAAQQRQVQLGTWRREATVATASSDHARAVALLTQAAELDGTARGYVDLGAALVKAGRAADAVDALQRAAGLGAGDDVYRHLADAYAALGQGDQSQRARAVYDNIRREGLRRAGRQ